MPKEYRTIQEVAGPLMLVHGVENVTYDELGEIELASGEVRRCKVLEINGEDALVLIGMQKRTYSILSSISFQNFLPNISQYLKNGFFCGADFDTPLPEL